MVGSSARTYLKTRCDGLPIHLSVAWRETLVGPHLVHSQHYLVQLLPGRTSRPRPPREARAPWRPTRHQRFRPGRPPGGPTPRHSWHPPQDPGAGPSARRRRSAWSWTPERRGIRQDRAIYPAASSRARGRNGTRAGPQRRRRARRGRDEPRWQARYRRPRRRGSK